MKTLFTRSLFTVITLLALFFSIGGVAPVGAAAQPQADTGGWIPMSAGLNGNVNAIVVNGTDIYVGGAFTNAGGKPDADYIAKWNGTNWSAVGAGLNGPVNAIAVSGTDVYVGGSFTSAGSVPKTTYIAKWNGSAWSALGAGLNNQVKALAIVGANVYAGGWFINAGGKPDADYVARWSGGWLPMGTGVNNKVNAFTVNGTDLYVGGGFSAAGGLPNTSLIAKWNDTGWSALGTTNSGLQRETYTIVVNGTDTYIGGASIETWDDPGYTQPMHKFNGSTWAPLSNVEIPFFTDVYTMVTDGTNIYAGGSFYYLNGADKKHIAKWDGATWSALPATPLNGAVNVVAMNGTTMIVGGAFTKTNETTTLNHIAMLSTTSQPVTISATSIGAQDGVVVETSENGNVGGVLDSASGTFVLGDTIAKKQYRSILSFDTSSIPDDAIIIKALLVLKEKPGGASPVKLAEYYNGVMVDIKKGFFGQPALELTDFQETADGTYTNGNRYKPFPNPLELTLIRTFINKLATNNGLTQLRLRFNLDDDNDAVADFAKFASGNATNEADRPQLIITYLP